MQRVLCGVTAVCYALCPCVLRGEEPVREQAQQALRRAVHFFRSEVATQGGYLWRYSADLSLREGEGKASDTMAWVQPPGTPSVGRTFLAAYEATGDPYYLEAARETAYGLVKGQLRSGGWYYSIEFDPQQRGRHAYRVEGGAQGRNVTTLDDDTTQSALRFLMRVDKTLGFEDEGVHEAAEYALNALLNAQYPNGAWPQRYDEFPDPTKFPVRRARYPDSWSRRWPERDYRSHYTFNDNTLADMIETMLEAGRVYNEPKYRAAALKAGDFILLAQMPEPQPAWAQQYDAAMHPAWARRFEPPAVTGGESQGVMRTLLMLYRRTGDEKYLEPLPRAIEYFRRSVLSDGRLARFYELRTNRPLFFTMDYELTYDDGDLPTHYGFKVGNGVERIAREYARLKELGGDELKRLDARRRPRLSESLVEQTKAVIAALDPRGAWVEEGPLRFHDNASMAIIDSRTFVRNVDILIRYLTAVEAAD